MTKKLLKLLLLILITAWILPTTLLANVVGFIYENCAAGFRRGQKLAEDFPDNLGIKDK